MRRRGLALLEDDLTDEPPPGADLAQEDDDEQDEEELLEDLVLLEAGDRDGLLQPASEMFAQLRAELGRHRAG